MNTETKWWRGENGEWYVVLQFVLFALIAAAPFLTRQYSGWSAPVGMIGRALGLLLMVGGALLTLSAVASLGGNLAAVPRPKESAELVQSGPYKIVRHPIYSGIILGAFGWALFMNSLLTLLLALVLFFFFDIKSRREEQWLCEKFNAYPAYQKRVRKLLPFIY